MDQRLTDIWSKLRRTLGFVGLAFVVSLILAFMGIRVLSTVAQLAVLVFGIWLCVRWLRYLTRQAIWRLRNRSCPRVSMKLPVRLQPWLNWNISRNNRGS